MKIYIDREKRPYVEKMKKICKLLTDSKKEITIYDLLWLPVIFKEPLMVLGPERIRALGYQKNILYEEINNILKEAAVKDLIIKKFRIGGRYLRKEIKLGLENIFKEVRYNKTPVSTYILKIFNVTQCKFIDSEGKESRGYIINSIK